MREIKINLTGIINSFFSPWHLNAIGCQVLIEVTRACDPHLHGVLAVYYRRWLKIPVVSSYTDVWKNLDIMSALNLPDFHSICYI